MELDGASPNMAVIGNYEADEGRFFSETENTRHMNVAFVGHDIKAKFFGQGDPSDRPSTWTASRSRLWAWPRPRDRCFGSRRIISW